MTYFHIVRLPYATFGIEVNRDGRIVETAPIGRWMTGKSIDEIERWAKNKGGGVQ